MKQTTTSRAPLALLVLAVALLALWALLRAPGPGLPLGDFGPPHIDGMIDGAINGQAFTGSLSPGWLGDLPRLLLAGGVVSVTLLAVAALALVLILLVALPMALLAGLALVAGLVLLPVLGIVLAAVGGPLLAGVLVLALLLLPLLLLGKLLRWLLR